METKREDRFTYHALSDKERKNLVILDLIRKNGPLSRTDISRITDINIVSVSNYMKSYLDNGFVVETGLETSTGGRRAELVELNKKNVFALGIEIGPTNTRLVLADCALGVVAETLSSYNGTTDEAIADQIASAVKNMLTQAGIAAAMVRAAGIGTAHARFTRLVTALRERIGVATFAGNTAACAAFGEKTLNREADVEDFLYMYSDIGCGIVIRGDIYCGSSGNAGEIGVSHEHISKEEEMVLSRDSQYLRPWGADLSIAEAARREIEKGIGTKMVALAHGNIASVTTDTVIAAAQDEDEIARDIIHATALNLGVRIAYLVNLFNPAVVVIGGGMEKAGELILAPIRATVKKFALNEQGSSVKIIPSILGEYAVARGAASLAIREAFLRA